MSEKGILPPPHKEPGILRGCAVFGISEQQKHIFGMIDMEGEQGRVGAEGIQAGQT